MTEPKLDSAPDPRALLAAPESLRARLMRLIEHGDSHLLLTGSDPAMPGGCCPSDEVAAATRLVRAGWLSAWTPSPPEGACPVTLFALAGELEIHDGYPAFVRREDVRARLRERLAAASRRRTVLRGAAGGLLLAYALLCAGWIMWKETAAGAASNIRELTLEEAAEIGDGDAVLVCLFRGNEHCRFCESLETLTRETLNRHFKDELRGGQILLREINYDQPGRARFKGLYGLPTASLVLFKIQKGRIQAWRLLREAWEWTEDPKRFERMLVRALREETEHSEWTNGG